MKCPQCNYECLPDFGFCPQCGRVLQHVCGRCGFQMPADFAFCPKCGTPAAPPAAQVQQDTQAMLAESLRRLVPREYAERLLAAGGEIAGERRMVTILRSDVKGSSAMARGMDPEEVMEIMDGAFEVLIEPIARYEGTVARLEGDAIMAFFGAPIAHEDDAERACRAALEIVEGARAYAARLQERGIEGFKVRVGIHTGLVVMGEVGTDLRMEYTAMGEAPNLTARLESAAEPGTVLISEEAHRLIAPLFETEALEPIEVKGWKQPVPVFHVLAPKEVPVKVRGIAGRDSPLVGREAEFAALQEAVERLQVGVGGVVTLVGEAGIGKSRLVAEVQKQTLEKVHANRQVCAPSQGLGPPRWVEGRCLSYGTSIAYRVWLDVLRSALGVSLQESPGAVAEKLRRWVERLCPEGVDAVYPYLARLMSLPMEENDEAMLDQLDGQRLREQTFAAAETALRCSAQQEPLVMILEDLHWADTTSLALLEHVLPLIEDVPLLLVAVFRPHKEHGAWRLRETAAQQHADRHLDLVLDPLVWSDSEVLMENLLGAGGLPEELTERILGRAEGNPFFVEEIIRSLIDSGAIVQDEAGGRWDTAREVADIPIPDTLQGVLTARIDRLPEESRRILQTAAVIGRIFLFRVLAAVAQDERDLDLHLLTLQREQMIRERVRVPELEYIFKHDLTREAAYNGLLKKERRAFHRQVAETLEQLFPDRVEEQAGVLAHHWERAGDAEKAVHYLQRAGDQARLAYAHEEAIDYYQRALVFLREAKHCGQAARTLMKLGLTYHTAFAFRASRQAYEEGFALWQRAARMESAVPPPPAPHALRLSVGAPRTLDTAVTSSLESARVIAQLFSGLVEITPQLDIVPDVARGWEMLEGGRKYVFHLRDDVRWSDGTPVTAGDFECAWKRMLDPAIEALDASLLYDVKGARAFHQGDLSDPDHVGVRAPDEVTLVVELVEPTGYFLQLVGIIFPVPRHVVAVHGEAWAEPSNMVTNGPFRLEAWNKGESMILLRNPQYHGRFAGNLERVEVRCAHFMDWSGDLERYEADGLDVLSIKFLPITDLHRARQRHAEDYVSLPRLHTWCLAFNVSQSPFDDRRVRRAFALALDKERLYDEILPNWGFPATGGLVPPGMPGHSPGIGLPYDPDQARQLLAEAGYPGGRGFPHLDLWVFRSPIAPVPCEYVRTQWRENLGVAGAWETLDGGMDWGRYSERLRKQPPHLRWANWAPDYGDPDSFLGTFVGGLVEEFGWRNEVYERLVQKASRLTDQAERMRVYAQAEQILVEEAVVIPMTYGRSHLLLKPWVKSYFPSAGVGFASWKDVIIESH